MNTRWFPTWGNARKGKLLCGVFWNLMDGVAQNELMDLGGCNAVFYSPCGSDLAALEAALTEVNLTDKMYDNPQADVHDISS